MSLLLFWDRVFLILYSRLVWNFHHSPGWSEARDNPPLSASQLSLLQARTTMASFNIVGYYSRNVHFFDRYHKHPLKFAWCCLCGWANCWKKAISSLGWQLSDPSLLPVCLNEGALSQLVPLTTARLHPRQFISFEQPWPSAETPFQLQGRCSHRYLGESHCSAL